jgi:hypothetical protein
MIESQLGTHAKVLAIALEVGLADHDDAVSWADTLILQLESPSQNLIDVSMSGRDLKELISALNRLAEELQAQEPPAIWKPVLAFCRDRLTKHPDDGPRIAWLLANIESEADRRASGNQSVLYFDYAYDEARRGIGQSRHEIDAEFLEFLNRLLDGAS